MDQVRDDLSASEQLQALMLAHTPELQPQTNRAASLPKAASSGRQIERFAPRVPDNLAETGLPASLLEQLILKFLYYRGDMMSSDLSRALGLPFGCVDDIVARFKLQHFIQVKSSLGYGPISELLSLTERGRRVARDYLETNQYVGPAPVPITQYCAAVEAQRTPARWLTPERLANAYSHLVITDDMLDQIGPAASSGKSLLIYGQPGNGKTEIADALARIQCSDIYVPYSIECQGNIVQLYDPIYHQLATREDDPRDTPCDGRWARCRRPFIASGGELSLSMLDLSYNPTSRVYDAPLQLKANNGIYLIDDFGRQKAATAEILNRWIVPMDRSIDYLSFANGGMMTVPFETFLIFSTNVSPDKLGDEAFLRRIQYKILVTSPGKDEFSTIFSKVCESHGLEAPRALVEAFITKHYLRTGKQFRRCHPRDIIAQTIDHIHFKRLHHELSEDLLDSAFAGCFLSARELTET